jgi:hypothetical protein
MTLAFSFLFINNNKNIKYDNKKFPVNTKRNSEVYDKSLNKFYMIFYSIKY